MDAAIRQPHARLLMPEFDSMSFPQQDLCQLWLPMRAFNIIQMDTSCNGISSIHESAESQARGTSMGEIHVASAHRPCMPVSQISYDNPMSMELREVLYHA